MTAYIAGPLFSQAEKEFNLRVDAVVRSLGLDTFLPQRDGGEAARLVRQGMDEHTVRQRLFDLDCAAIADCMLFVFILDGGYPMRGRASSSAWPLPAASRALACRLTAAVSVAPTPTT